MNCREHYLKENCHGTKGWFEEIGRDKKEINRRLWEDENIAKANVS